MKSSFEWFTSYYISFVSKSDISMKRNYKECSRDPMYHEDEIAVKSNMRLDGFAFLCRQKSGILLQLLIKHSFFLTWILSALMNSSTSLSSILFCYSALQPFTPYPVFISPAFMVLWHTHTHAQASLCTQVFTPVHMFSPTHMKWEVDMQQKVALFPLSSCLIINSFVWLIFIDLF